MGGRAAWRSRPQAPSVLATSLSRWMSAGSSVPTSNVWRTSASTCCLTVWPVPNTTSRLPRGDQAAAGVRTICQAGLPNCRWLPMRSGNSADITASDSPQQVGLLSLPASLLAIAGPMLRPMLVQRIGTPLSVAGLLAIAALGFGVLTLVGGPMAAFTVALGWMLWALGGSAAATLTTDTLIGSAPPERAGGVAALAQTGAELGGALGIAALGSLGTAIYRGMVASALPQGLPPELAATARDTLGGALSVASQVPDSPAAATLVLTAQDALTTALHVTSAIGAVSSIVMALAVAIYLRTPRRECQVSSAHACQSEPAMAA